MPSFRLWGNNSSDTPFAAALKQGLLYGSIFLGLLFIWMGLRGDETAYKLQSLIPGQNVEIAMPGPKAKQEAQATTLTPEEELAKARALVALPPAPIEKLAENVGGKLLPVSRIEDDMTPFLAYKYPFQPKPNVPMISFVIVDYGLSGKIAQTMLDNLPPEITFALTPYAEDAVKWGAAARAYGHEFWLSLPMQSRDLGQNDTGPEALMINAIPAENQARLLSVMGSVAGYAGLVTQKNHVFTKGDAQDPVLTQIFGRGLGMVESNPDMPAYGLSAAMEGG